MPHRRALVTGATGFAGSHLCARCIAMGWEVHGTTLDSIHDDASSARTLHQIDLNDGDALEALVASVRPDFVFHLAGQAAVGAAWKDPVATLIANVVPTERLLHAVRQGAADARVLVVGSSEEYGVVEPASLPVSEDHPLRPIDPYGVSKVAADLLGQQHFLAYHTRVVRVRPFNHIGPGQRRGFVLADFAADIVAIERGQKAPVLRVGNLDSERDFTDVRDVARAYILALEHGVPGAVYNVCSGQTVRIRSLLDGLMTLTTTRLRIEVDPERYRPVDRPATIGSFQALHSVTGWKPEVPLAQSVADVLDYWRNQP